MVKFIHTADWQIGKPYSRVGDQEKRTALRQERIKAVERIGDLAREQGAGFVLVAGDLFDSDSPDKSTVSAACRAIGQIGLPVLAIPGNHDHAGPGSIWEQSFFRQEQRDLAPNFCLLSENAPWELEEAVIFACPLVRRHEADDVTEWLRNPDVLQSFPADKPRIILAHGSVQGFSSADDGEESAALPNRIDLARLPVDAFDYVALGDWHGTKSISEPVWCSGRAWYSGTPEPDRFTKGGGHDPGNVLSVIIAGRGTTPQVSVVRTARLGWFEDALNIADDTGLDLLEQRLNGIMGDRVQQDLLQLTLTGRLGFEDEQRLHNIIERITARLLRLKLVNEIQIIPSDAEVAALKMRAGDPLISALADRLDQEQQAGNEKSDKARLAMRLLYAAVAKEGGMQ